MLGIDELTALLILSSPCHGCNFQKHTEYETKMLYASQLLSPSLFLSTTCDGVTSWSHRYGPNILDGNFQLHKNHQSYKEKRENILFFSKGKIT